MNPESTPEAMNPNQTEAPADAGRPSVHEEAGQKKSGLLQRLLGVVRWFDRGLDLEGRDTSDWNIYYYYFRQVAQHRAPIKLKYLKWFALAFQLYFFGSIVFAIINGILAFEAAKTSGQGEGFGGLAIFAFLGLGLAGLASNLLLLPMLLLPVIVVAPAFRLRSKNRALITSRAKEPPLLAHLVQYTSHKGLVQGVLQSFLYTWKRLLILLSPCLIPILLFLAWGIVGGIVSGDLTAAAFLRFAFTPVSAVLCILAVSLFFLMQPFCYRLDSLMVAIGVGFETIMLIRFIIMFKLTPTGLVPAASAASSADFLAFSSVYIVSCLFAIVYFPLAAADTGELGLGKQTSKWLRILLYTAAGVFLALILLSKAFFASLNDSSYQGELGELLAMVMVWGLAICICGLLVTSMSTTSPLATRQLQTRAKEPFLKRLFDPASPLSLLPVIALELITLATVFILFRWDAIRTPGIYHGAVGTLILYSCGSRARNAWTAIHFGLAFAYARQRRKPEMKAPWDFHVRFNMIVLITYVAIQLFLALTSRSGAGFVGIVLYIVSIIVLFTSFGFLKSPASTYKVVDPQSEPEQDKEEAS